MATQQPTSLYTESKACTSALTTFDDHILFNPGAMHMLALEVETDGDDLADFAIQLKDHPDGEWFTFLSSTDFDTATSSMQFATSTGPHEVTDGDIAHVHVNVRAAHAVRFQAQASSGASTVTVRATIASYGRSR